MYKILLPSTFGWTGATTPGLTHQTLRGVRVSTTAEGAEFDTSIALNSWEVVSKKESFDRYAD